MLDTTPTETIKTYIKESIKTKRTADIQTYDKVNYLSLIAALIYFSYHLTRLLNKIALNPTKESSPK